MYSYTQPVQTFESNMHLQLQNVKNNWQGFDTQFAENPTERKLIFLFLDIQTVKGTEKKLFFVINQYTIALATKRPELSAVWRVNCCTINHLASLANYIQNSLMNTLLINVQGNSYVYPKQLIILKLYIFINKYCFYDKLSYIRSLKRVGKINKI